jgi:hypothetical protein
MKRTGKRYRRGNCIPGEFKIPSGFGMGTFRKLLLITFPRRFGIRVSKAINLESLI